VTEVGPSGFAVASGCISPHQRGGRHKQESRSWSADTNCGIARRPPQHYSCVVAKGFSIPGNGIESPFGVYEE
jgi:hypothetical protein